MNSIDLIFALATVLLIAVNLIIGGLLLARSFFGHRESVNRAMNEDLEVIRVAHEVVPDNTGDRESWKEEIGAMEELLATFARMYHPVGLLTRLIYGQPTITLEIANPANAEEIFFYVAAPRKIRTAVEKQVHSYFPSAEVEKIQDYTIFAPGSAVAAGLVKLNKSHALPLNSYRSMTVDPLSEITNALSKLEGKDEGACLQISLQKAPIGWAARGKKIAREMQQGKRLKDVTSSGVVGRVVHEFFDIVLGINRKPTGTDITSESKNVQLTPEEQDLIKEIESKANKAAFNANIRLIASAPEQSRADEILSHMENAMTQFHNMDVNSLRVKRFKGYNKDIAFNYIFRSFNRDFNMTLGIEEVASIFHFPISTTETPKIQWVQAGSAPPPVQIPSEGLVLGYNKYRGVESPIRLTPNDRRRHLYVIGQTGTGKSTFLQEIAKQDAREKKGMCFIDPHGDAIADIMTAIPADRAEDVIYFDPSDTERPFGLNMIEFDKPEEKTFVVNEIINIFDKLYDLKSTGGPMFEQYMRNTLLLIMEDPETGSTLMEVPKVLADEEFRKMKLSKCKNPTVRDFWTKEAEKAGGEAALANMVPYITSKLTPFLSNDMMRPIISQQKSTINFREAMDSGKIVLVNLSKGKLGEMNSHLLGMIIVGKLLMAALSRTDIPEDDRKDFYLFIDEFQNVTTDSIAQILSEARKYRLSLVIAHQFIGQLSDEISKAVFGNVGSMAAFRVGPEDAEFLEKQFEPVFNAQDLMNVGNFNCFARVLIDNKTVPAFNMSTYPPSDGSHDIVDELKELSRLKYGRDRTVIEQEVEARSQIKPEPKSAEHYFAKS